MTPTRHPYLDLCRHGKFFLYLSWVLPLATKHDVTMHNDRGGFVHMGG
jgi:hypothetical protein